MLYLICAASLMLYLICVFGDRKQNQFLFEKYLCGLNSLLLSVPICCKANFTCISSISHLFHFTFTWAVSFLMCHLFLSFLARPVQDHLWLQLCLHACVMWVPLWQGETSAFFVTFILYCEVLNSSC